MKRMRTFIFFFTTITGCITAYSVWYIWKLFVKDYTLQLLGFYIISMYLIYWSNKYLNDYWAIGRINYGRHPDDYFGVPKIKNEDLNVFLFYCILLCSLHWVKNSIFKRFVAYCIIFSPVYWMNSFAAYAYIYFCVLFSIHYWARSDVIRKTMRYCLLLSFFYYLHFYLGVASLWMLYLFILMRRVRGKRRVRSVVRLGIFSLILTYTFIFFDPFEIIDSWRTMWRQIKGLFFLIIMWRFIKSRWRK